MNEQFLSQFPDTPLGPGEVAPGVENPTPEWAARILEPLAPRRFDPANPPPKIAPIITLKGTPVATAGNICLLSGQAGAAKSHSLAAIIASALAPEGSQVDTLGWSMPNPAGRGVFYLDFEQSEQDFHALMKSALRRAGVDTLPPWFCALHLTGQTPETGRDVLLALLVDARERFRGTRTVLLDGIADLCNSPNDEGEAFALVRRVHAWADEFQCAVVSVLHVNAGSDSPKMRGHLGSQAERKAETVLISKRTEDTLTIFATKTRHRPIPEREGTRIAWDEAAGMFATVATVAEAQADRKTEANRQLAGDLFATAAGLTYSEVIDRLIELTGKSESTAKRRLGELRECRFVKVQAGTGYYHKGPEA